MNDDEELTPLGAEMVAGMTEFCDVLESGEAVEKRYTIRTVSLDLQTKAYGPDDVKRVREALNASQALLAKFLGVSVKTLRSWEQGARPVPTIACRYLDDLVSYPELWNRRLRVTSPGDRGKSITP